MLTYEQLFIALNLSIAKFEVVDSPYTNPYKASKFTTPHTHIKGT